MLKELNKKYETIHHEQEAEIKALKELIERERQFYETDKEAIETNSTWLQVVGTIDVENKFKALKMLTRTRKTIKN